MQYGPRKNPHNSGVDLNQGADVQTVFHFTLMLYLKKSLKKSLAHIQIIA